MTDFLRRSHTTDCSSSSAARTLRRRSWQGAPCTARAFGSRGVVGHGGCPARHLRAGPPGLGRRPSTRPPPTTASRKLQMRTLVNSEIHLVPEATRLGVGQRSVEGPEVDSDERMRLVRRQPEAVSSLLEAARGVCGRVPLPSRGVVGRCTQCCSDFGAEGSVVFGVVDHDEDVSPVVVVFDRHQRACSKRGGGDRPGSLTRTNRSRADRTRAPGRASGQRFVTRSPSRPRRGWLNAAGPVARTVKPGESYGVRRRSWSRPPP